MTFYNYSHATKCQQLCLSFSTLNSTLQEIPELWPHFKESVSITSSNQTWESVMKEDSSLLHSKVETQVTEM